MNNRNDHKKSNKPKEPGSAGVIRDLEIYIGKIIIPNTVLNSYFNYFAGIEC